MKTNGKRTYSKLKFIEISQYAILRHGRRTRDEHITIKGCEEVETSSVLKRRKKERVSYTAVSSHHLTSNADIGLHSGFILQPRFETLKSVHDISEHSMEQDITEDVWDS